MRTIQKVFDSSLPLSHLVFSLCSDKNSINFNSTFYGNNPDLSLDRFSIPNTSRESHRKTSSTNSKNKTQTIQSVHVTKDQPGASFFQKTRSTNPKNKTQTIQSVHVTKDQPGASFFQGSEYTRLNSLQKDHEFSKKVYTDEKTETVHRPKSPNNPNLHLVLSQEKITIDAKSFARKIKLSK